MQAKISYMIEVFRTVTQLVVSPHASHLGLTKVEGEWRLCKLYYSFNEKECVLLHRKERFHKESNRKGNK